MVGKKYIAVHFINIEAVIITPVKMILRLEFGVLRRIKISNNNALKIGSINPILL